MSILSNINTCLYPEDYSKVSGQQGGTSKEEIATKTLEACERIKHFANHLDAMTIVVSHSGGKDSCVVHHIVRSTLLPFTVEHTVKDKLDKEDVLFLYYHVQEVWLTPIITKDFRVLRIDGTRKSEANRSNGRSVDVVVDGEVKTRDEMKEYTEDGIAGPSLFPIYDWTDQDVWSYLIYHNLPVSTIYGNSTFIDRSGNT
jgi:3'-phosphoadenosine 5'-phosphosulfate sulfotransferase (PAPS reductase)/FAD synthetase